MLVVCYPLGLDRKRRLNVCQRRSLSLRFVFSCSVCRFLLSIDIMSLEISDSFTKIGSTYVADGQILSTEGANWKEISVFVPK